MLNVSSDAHSLLSVYHRSGDVAFISNAMTHIKGAVIAIATMARAASNDLLSRRPTRIAANPEASPKEFLELDAAPKRHEFGNVRNDFYVNRLVV